MHPAPIWPLLLPTALCALGAAGCAPTSVQRPSSGQVSSEPERPARLHRATVPLAAQYGQARPVSPAGFEGRVVALLLAAAARAGKVAPVVDSATQATAREICRGLLPKGPPPADLVSFAMSSNGLVEPPPHILVAEMPPPGRGSEDMVLRTLGERLKTILQEGDFSRAGVAVEQPRAMPGSKRALVVLLESHLHIHPLPRQLQAGRQARVALTLGRGFRGPKLVVTGPDGRISSNALPLVSGEHRGELRCALQGIYKVEITATGAYGPEVLANFPVYCDQAPPKTVRVVQQSWALGRPAELEREIFGKTNRIRQQRGLPPLSHNEVLARAARLHSEDMRRSGFVGHVSPSTGSPTDRIRRAGLAAVLVRENLARGYSVTEVINGLMDSPAHRENILSRDVTQTGVGVVIDRGGRTPVLLVTQKLIKPGTPYSAATSRKDVLALIGRLRRERSLARLAIDPVLDRLAGEYTRQAAAGGRAEREAEQALSRALDQLGGRFRKVDSLQVRVLAIETLAQARELYREGYTHLGLGVGQAKELILIFILFARAR